MTMNREKVETEVIDLLEHSELRMTRQRRAIVRQILTMSGHFSADDLLTAFDQTQEEASRATIYRLIPALIELGIVREVEHGYDHSHYEVVRDPGHHEHLMCQRCGKVTEFVCPAIEEAIVEVCQEHNFRQYQHGLEVTGLCGECAGSSSCRDAARRILTKPEIKQ